ncbi:hypothetical protein C0J45_11170 [Silurus meridionalis]|nr:hypothetical protein C0J45_11170 [Silurus meridionalis]
MGIGSQQGTSGNWATVGQRRRRRGGRFLQRQQGKEKCRKVEVKMGTPNVGTMTVLMLHKWVESVSRKERLVIGADFNCHVGEGNRGDEEVMVGTALRRGMWKGNTYFKKRVDHTAMYKSGGRCTQVDYVLCRRCNLKEIGDCKVLAGDSVARQHRMVVCRMVMEAKKKRRRVRTKKRIRWWKLKEEDCSVIFRKEVRQGLGGGEEVLDDLATTAEVIREAARKVLGVTSGKRKEDKEMWWWNEELQESIRGKRLAKQNWERQRD